MPDLEAKVPEHVEDVFRHALRPGGLLPRKEEKEIDVGVGRERAAPVTADRDQRQLLGGGGVARRKDAGRGEIEQRVDDRIGERGEALGAALALAVLLQPVADEAAPVRQHLLQEVQHRLPRRRRVRAALGGNGGELGLQPVVVDRAFRWSWPLHSLAFASDDGSRARLARQPGKWHFCAHFRVLQAGWISAYHLARIGTGELVAPQMWSCATGCEMVEGWASRPWRRRLQDRFGLMRPSAPYGLARRWLRGFIHFFSYHLILARQSTRRARAAGFELVVRPTVFHPRYFLTSEYFASFIDKLDLKGKSVAEVGTGSGVLSLAAARAGAERVVAIDINPNAALSAGDNARLNGLAARVFPRLLESSLRNRAAPALRRDPVEPAVLRRRAARRRRPRLGRRPRLPRHRTTLRRRPASG